MTSNYTATVTRVGRWWMVEIPELDLLTQARRLGEAELMAQEIIALHTDQAVEDIDVTINLGKVGAIDLTAEVESLARHRAAAAKAESDAMRATRALALELAEHDVPTRDIGPLIGVSHQRASQLVEEARRQ